MNFVDPLGLSPMDVVNWASGQIGSWSYAYWTPHTEVRGNSGKYFGGMLTPKCNAFVYDATKAGHCEAGRLENGRIPTAGEWADPTIDIPGCSVVDHPTTGDIVAFNGHVGIYVPLINSLPGTISAASSGQVVHNNWGFRNGQTPTFRRCSCSK